MLLRGSSWIKVLMGRNELSAVTFEKQNKSAFSMEVKVCSGTLQVSICSAAVSA
jgi:hypothetical protein